MICRFLNFLRGRLRYHDYFGTLPVYKTIVNGVHYKVSPTQRHGDVQEFDLQKEGSRSWMRYAVITKSRKDHASWVKLALREA